MKLKFQLRYPRWAKNLSASAKDLLSHLLDVNPSSRFTAEEALAHPWVQGETAPKENLLASPGRIKKSPALRGSVTRYTGGKKKNPVEAKLTPPTPTGPMMRKSSI